MIADAYRDKLTSLRFASRSALTLDFGPRCRLAGYVLPNAYLVWIKRGDGQLKVDQSAYSVRAGCWVLLRPGSLLEGAAGEEGLGCVVIRFYCEMASVSEQVPSSVDKASPMKHLLSPRTMIAFRSLPGAELALAQLLQFERQLGSAPSNGLPLLYWKRQLLFQELIYALLSQEPDHQEHDQDLFERIIAYMKEHFTEQLSIKDLAQAHGISPSNFATWFRRHTAMSPMRYLTGLRMERAKPLLMQRHRLSEIAGSVGYKDELYFSRSFKKTVGVSPSTYIKKHRARHLMTVSPILNDYLVALGVEPLATLDCPNWRELVGGKLPYMTEQLLQTRVVTRLNKEHIAETLGGASPQLILGEQFHLNCASPEYRLYSGYSPGEVMGMMNEVAPTIMLSIHNDWRQLFAEIAELLEYTDRLRDWFARYDSIVESARQRLSGITVAKCTVMLLVAGRDDFRVYGGKRQLGEVLYRDLGLMPPAGIRLNEHFRRVSISELTGMNPDYIFLTERSAYDGQPQRRLLLESEQWQSLDCVRNNRVFGIESWLNHQAPLKQQIAIDRVLASLQEK